MDTAPSPLASLRRPPLLLRAARHGLGLYRRERDLRRLIGSMKGPGRAVGALLDAEAEAEARRVEGDARYDVIRHIAILAALIAEAHFLEGSRLGAAIE
jgi:hypothetical protein